MTCLTASLTHYLRVGYRLPTLIATLLDADRDPIDLTAATDVVFVMEKQGTSGSGTPKIDHRSVTILSAPVGEVEVGFEDGDVDVRATYDAYFVIVYPGGLELPVPNPGFFTVIVAAA